MATAQAMEPVVTDLLSSSAGTQMSTVKGVKRHVTESVRA